MATLELQNKVGVTICRNENEDGVPGAFQITKVDNGCIMLDLNIDGTEVGVSLTPKALVELLSHLV